MNFPKNFRECTVVDSLSMCERNLENIPNRYRENCSQTSTKLRNSNFYFTALFLEIWWSDFSEIFRECRGDEYLSFRKFIGSFRLQKNFRVKFLKILFGGPRSQGLAKSKKLLRSVDRGSPALYNAVKIVALWQANSQIIDVKIYQIKYSDPNFSNSGRQISTKFSANVEGSMYYRPEKIRKNLSTVKIVGSNLIKIRLGGAPSQGVQKFQKVLRWLDRGS